MEMSRNKTTINRRENKRRQNNKQREKSRKRTTIKITRYVREGEGTISRYFAQSVREERQRTNQGRTARQQEAVGEQGKSVKEAR